MYRILSGVFMGWALGANDSANVFGTAVASRKIKFWTAALLCCCFVFLGAVTGGANGMKTLGRLASLNLDTAFAASLGAGLTVFIITLFKLPVSTSQAMVGGIIGVGLHAGGINLPELVKILLVWVGTPLGAALLSLALYPLLGRLLDGLHLNIFDRDALLKAGLILAGCYAAWSLGANNVANVTGVYSHLGIITVFQALLIGGASIALGTLSFSRQVMLTVGARLVHLDTFSAFIAVLAQAIVLDVYARVGVPTSASQAIIGAILGIGLYKGIQTINVKTLLSILFAWVGTPALAGGIAYGLYYLV